MIRLNHLSIRNIKEDRQLLTDLSFVVNPGEKIALIGEEGNGKSSGQHQSGRVKERPFFFANPFKIFILKVQRVCAIGRPLWSALMGKDNPSADGAKHGRRKKG